MQYLPQYFPAGWRGSAWSLYQKGNAGCCDNAQRHDQQLEYEVDLAATLFFGTVHGGTFHQGWVQFPYLSEPPAPAGGEPHTCTHAPGFDDRRHFGLGLTRLSAGAYVSRMSGGAAFAVLMRETSR